jgi:Na+/H+ antiporter NhaD/arsenite permease-like protein
MLARLAFFVSFAVVIVLLPLILIDADDGMEMRIFLQVMIPCAAFAIVAFGFCDQLFFKLKLYDIDEHNMVTEQPDVDPFESYRANKINLTESVRNDSDEKVGSLNQQ